MKIQQLTYGVFKTISIQSLVEMKKLIHWTHTFENWNEQNIIDFQNKNQIQM